MNRRGQFFLIAAAIIVTIALGVSTVSNVAVTTQDEEFLKDLSEEVGFEAKRVIDYGFYTTDDPLALTKNFLFDYSDYIGQDQVLFVYGELDQGNIEGLFFRQEDIGSVGIETGGDHAVIPIERRTGRTAEVFIENGKIKAMIDDRLHEFPVRQGNNFFYIVIKEERGQRIVNEG